MCYLPPVLSPVSWNVDGVARLLSGELVRVHAALGKPDVLCLQEVRVRPGDHDVIDAMAKALPGHRCFFSLCDDPTNVRFRGGRAYGVASYVRETLDAQRLPSPSWDREGRIVTFVLPEERLVVGNLYAVNGTTKPHFDHERGVMHGDRHAFKRAFQERLITLFAPLLAEQNTLVLAGDWNVSRTPRDTYPRLRTELPHALARAHLNETLLPALDLVDPFRELHPTTRRYSWFSRRAPEGKLDAARVDYVLVSRALRGRVVEAGIEDAPAMRFGSDHAPVTLLLGPRVEDERRRKS